jgi:hypothetical protein
LGCAESNLEVTITPPTAAYEAPMI